ncbi:hypothetical protein J8L98_11650 [Pseudoalteromonas sp. MMG013]|uniref:hypothetical protein n=1 Tax=Pseudoalteromonas sp. MMG013 TaxID=2822687 RepID=UPI001B367F51|nr:hypothetical protein [Pseudoalteromonas sp. MMG013]MBQ4862344.1 hypothetical protein [Pseudoalteromonas sp. MMG013]
MRFFIFIFLLCFPFLTFAQKWHQIDPNTFIISPPKNAIQLQTNLAILTGKNCAAVINAHGDFTAIELTIKQIKNRIKVPVCYLISTSSDIHEVVGIALMQRAFPAASWIAPSHVKHNLSNYQLAYNDKISQYVNSYEVSTQRVENFDLEGKALWKNKMRQANQRIQDWKSIPLRAPIEVKKQLQLGNHLIDIETYPAFSKEDLFIFSHLNNGMFAGTSVDPIPYVTHSKLSQWLETLSLMENTSQIKWLLPSHGKPYKRAALNKPITFLRTVMKHSIRQNNKLPEELLKRYPKKELQPKLTLLYQIAVQHNPKNNNKTLSVQMPNNPPPQL